VAAVLASAALAACSGESAVERLAVTPTVDVPESVALGEPLDIGYSWAVADDFEAPADDYQVFLHMRDAEGNILAQDDHYPPIPTSQWQPGSVQSYRRWFYPETDFEVESIDFVVGLYADDGRAALAWEGGFEDMPVVSRMQIRVDDQGGKPVWVEGWHPVEEVPGQTPSVWRWSEQAARAVFANPRRDATLHFRAHSPVDEINGPQTVVLRMGETEIARFEIESASAFTERVEVAADVLGDDDWAELHVEVSDVFKPSELDPESQDDRELGLQMFLLFLSSSS
jgi:hypothetical protein